MRRASHDAALSLWIGLSIALTAGAQGQGSGPLPSGVPSLPAMPAVEVPPERFATAEAHYRYLHEAANGGTRHTMATIPVWDGLWSWSVTSMPSLFIIDGTFMHLVASEGEIREGVLTPAYEQHFGQRRAEMREYGQQRKIVIYEGVL